MSGSPPPTSPGVYFEVPLADYLAIPAVSSHTLGAFRRSPAHARAYMTGAARDTVDPDGIGSALHALVLEGPGALAERFTRAPDDVTDRRARAWRDQRDAEAAAGRVLMLARDHDAVTAMAAAVRSSPPAARALAGLAATEVTVLWTDPATGLLLKARVDGLNPTLLALIDLKSAVDAAPWAFAAATWRYGYHRQLALYRVGVRVAGLGDYREPVILAYEKEPPYVTVAYRVSERAMGAAADEIWGTPRRPGLLARYAECVATGNWPGYADTFVPLTLPAYGWRQLEQEGIYR